LSDIAPSVIKRHCNFTVNGKQQGIETLHHPLRPHGLGMHDDILKFRHLHLQRGMSRCVTPVRVTPPDRGQIALSLTHALRLHLRIA